METGEGFEDDAERPAALDGSGHSNPLNGIMIGLVTFKPPSPRSHRTRILCPPKKNHQRNGKAYQRLRVSSRAYPILMATP